MVRIGPGTYIDILQQCVRIYGISSLRSFCLGDHGLKIKVRQTDEIFQKQIIMKDKQIRF